MIVIVPARGGSTRLPKKNILPFAGKPLLAYTVDAYRESGMTFPIAVSTDDPEIAQVAREAGVRIIERPPALSTDTASTESALLHALEVFEEDAIAPEWIMSLQPTSPFRRGNLIRAFAGEIAEMPDAQDCLMSVTEDHGDYWWMDEDGQITRVFTDAPRRQQDRRPVFIENSAIYVVRVSMLRQTGSVIGGRIRGLPIAALAGFDIHNETDFRVAEAVARSEFGKAFLPGADSSGKVTAA